MRHDKALPGVGPEFAHFGSKRSRVGCPTFRCWTRARIALLVAVIGLPWLCVGNAPLTSLPLQLGPGQSRVPTWRFVFSPSGQAIARIDEQGRVGLHPIPQGGDTTCYAQVPGHAKAAAFSPDGHWLAIGRAEPDVILLDVRQPGRQRLLGIPVQEISDVKFSPDGRILAVSSYRSTEIILWDVQAGTQRMILRGHSSPVNFIAFSRDGRSLATSGILDRTVLLWDLADARPRHRLTGPSFVMQSLDYSPDGRLLVTMTPGEKGVRIWDAQTGTYVGLIADNDSGIHSAAVSPDWRLLATGACDQFVSLWSLESGRELRRLDSHAETIHNLAFSPDGRTLAAAGNGDDIRLWDLEGLIENSTTQTVNGNGDALRGEGCHRRPAENSAGHD
jgi:WD domain, G-beta repeat/WD40-like Beta Propeller Repeat